MEELEKNGARQENNYVKEKRRFGGEEQHEPNTWQCPNSTKTPTLPHGHSQQRGKGGKWKSQRPELPLQAQPGLFSSAISTSPSLALPFTGAAALWPDGVSISRSAKSSMPLVQSVSKLTQSRHLSSSPVLLCLFRSRIFALSVTSQSSLYSLPDTEFIGSTVFSESLTREDFDEIIGKSKMLAVLEDICELKYVWSLCLKLGGEIPKSISLSTANT